MTTSAQTAVDLGSQGTKVDKVPDLVWQPITGLSKEQDKLRQTIGELQTQIGATKKAFEDSLSDALKAVAPEGTTPLITTKWMTETNGPKVAFATEAQMNKRRSKSNDVEAVDVSKKA